VDWKLFFLISSSFLRIELMLEQLAPRYFLDLVKATGRSRLMFMHAFPLLSLERERGHGMGVASS